MVMQEVISPSRSPYPFSAIDRHLAKADQNLLAGNSAEAREELGHARQLMAAIESEKKKGWEPEIMQIEAWMAAIAAELAKMTRENQQQPPEKSQETQKDKDRAPESPKDKEHPVVKVFEKAGKLAVKAAVAVAVVEIAAPVVVPATKTFLGLAIALPILRSFIKTKSPASPINRRTPPSNPAARARSFLGTSKTSPTLLRPRIFDFSRPAASRSFFGMRPMGGAGLMGILSRGFSGVFSAMGAAAL
jgi:hypothetical protein